MHRNFYETLKTGDLIIFSGNNNIVSCAVKIALWSKWTHIGIVVRDPDFLVKQEKQKGLFLLNSDGPYEKDNETGNKISGVQIVDLRKKIESYDGYIVLRRLVLKDNEQHDDEDNDNRNKIVGEIYKKLYGLPYDYGIVNTLNIILNNNRKNCLTEIIIKQLNKQKKQKIEKLCCSGFVGYMYLSIGLLNTNTRWDLCTPEYFTKDDAMMKDIDNNSQYYLTPMVLVKNNCKL